MPLWWRFVTRDSGDLKKYRCEIDASACRAPPRDNQSACPAPYRPESPEGSEPCIDLHERLRSSRYRRRCASIRVSTNPASRSTRRCLETDGWDSRSSRSISPTERSLERSRLKMARLFGSATMANNDSTTDLGYGVHASIASASWRAASGMSVSQMRP
jgi:hypothetical protein